MGKQIDISLEEEKAIRVELAKRTDAEAQRELRFLSMPDLSRTEGSPINEIVRRVLAAPEFADMDIIKVPEIVPADISFDLFDFPADHPARSKSDALTLL